MSVVVLWAMAAAPFATAVVVGAIRSESIARALSLTAVGFGAVIALFAAALANGVGFDGLLECRATIEAWRLGPHEAAPSIVLSLNKDWSLAPLLLSGCVFLALCSAGLDQHGMIHWQWGAIQAAVLMDSPTMGMAAVTASTIAGAIQACRHGLPFGFRWIAADAVAWTWLVGLTGGEAWPIYVAVAVRVAIFPMHTGFIDALRRNDCLGLLLVPLAPMAWALRWLDPFPDAVPWRLVACIAAIAPAVFALGERHRLPAMGYRLIAILAWPLVLPTGVPIAISLVALGMAVVLVSAGSIWRSAAAAMSMVAPMLAATTASNGQFGAIATTTGCAVVSTSAFLVQWSPSPNSDADQPSNRAFEFAAALLVLAACTSLAIGISAGIVP